MNKDVYLRSFYSMKNHYQKIILVILGLIIPLSCNIQADNPNTYPTSIEQIITTSQNQLTPNFTETIEPMLAYWIAEENYRFNRANTQIAETKQAIFSLATAHPQMCGYQLEGVSISPDENWVASDCRFNGDFFRVFQTQGNQVWDIPYSAIFKSYPEFLGSVRALYWSLDGKYLYFANSSCCANTDAWTNGDALYRINLWDGNWVLVVPGNFNYYSVSPNGQKLLYLLDNQAGINKKINCIYLIWSQRKRI